MGQCQVDGCTQSVSKAGHTFCLEHWRAERAGKVIQCPGCKRWHEGRQCTHCASGHADDESGPSGYLSSTKIGDHFGVSNIKVNLILAELGWIEKYVKGWVPTERGNSLGANVKEMRNGTPFVVWPESILKHPALLQSIGEQSAPSKPQPPEIQPDNFRDKFPATFRTQDGHMVRSRAEALIDNWLYMQGIVHAYERKLPIEEDCYCDFYIPGPKGGVYIEFWGREKFANYRARQSAKQALYAKYKFQLIELGDAEIERLDDVLPRMLLKFGVESV